MEVTAAGCAPRNGDASQPVERACRDSAGVGIVEAQGGFGKRQHGALVAEHFVGGKKPRDFLDLLRRPLRSFPPGRLPAPHPHADQARAEQEEGSGFGYRGVVERSDCTQHRE